MKVKYNNIEFDSNLEIEYYNHLLEISKSQCGIEYFIYHPSKPLKITDKNYYTPDFLVVYNDRIEIIETKGYNQFSYMRDSIVHNAMLNKTDGELRKWVNEVLSGRDFNDDGRKIIYKKIKYMKKFGWVDFDFKNPNTLAKKRKEKINELEKQVKELIKFKKDTIKYFKLLASSKKSTKKQEEFFNNYLEMMKKELDK